MWKETLYKLCKIIKKVNDDWICKDHNYVKIIKKKYEKMIFFELQ